MPSAKLLGSLPPRTAEKGYYLGKWDEQRHVDNDENRP